MIDFVKKLKKEVGTEIRRIEAMDASSLKKSLQASRVLGAAFNRLKNFIMVYRFRDDAEEIHFFKHVKPHLCSHLIYYRKVYNIEMNRPVGSVEAQRTYLHHELDRIHEFQQKRQDFYRYIRSGATDHLCRAVLPDHLFHARQNRHGTLFRIVFLRARPIVLDQLRFQGGADYGQRNVAGISSN